MVATEIFMRYSLVENSTQNIFGDLTFSSKVHISRGNREKVIFGSHFEPLHRGGPSWGPWVFLGSTWGHAEELSSIKFWMKTISLLHPYMYYELSPAS